MATEGMSTFLISKQSILYVIYEGDKKEILKVNEMRKKKIQC
jgi:hypothetical protein